MIEEWLEKQFGKWGILVVAIGIVVSFVISSINSPTLDRLINYNLQYTYLFEYDNLTNEQKLLVIIKNSGYSNSSSIKIDIESVNSSICEIFPLDTINLIEVKHFTTNPFLVKTYILTSDILPGEYLRYEFILKRDSTRNKELPNIEIFSKETKVIYSKELEKDSGFNYNLLWHYGKALFFIIISFGISTVAIIFLLLLLWQKIKKTWEKHKSLLKKSNH